MSDKDEKKGVAPERPVAVVAVAEGMAKARASADEELSAKRSQRRATAYGRARGCA